MSVLETVKSAFGLGDDARPTYRCQACGSEFRTTSEPGSHWFECPDCGSSDADPIEE